MSELEWVDRFCRNVQVIEMYADGKTLRTIGELLGLSHVAVIAILKGAGIPRRSKNARDVARTAEERLAALDARYKRARERICSTSPRLGGSDADDR